MIATNMIRFFFYKTSLMELLKSFDLTQYIFNRFQAILRRHTSALRHKWKCCCPSRVIAAADGCCMAITAIKSHRDYFKCLLLVVIVTDKVTAVQNFKLCFEQKRNGKTRSKTMNIFRLVNAWLKLTDERNGSAKIQVMLQT